MKAEVLERPNFPGPCYRNIFIKFPGLRVRENCRINFCVCLNWFISRLMSCGVVPLPLAILRRRLPLRISGLRRSSGVIDRIIASTLLI